MISQQFWIRSLLRTAWLVVAAVMSGSALAADYRDNWMVKVYEKNCGSIVCIEGEKYDEYGDNGRESGKNGMGTGIVIDPRGYIITNQHVIEGIRNIKVTTSDKTKYTATLIGRDPDSDLAIIKIIPKTPLHTITMGRSDNLKFCDDCMTIGNPFGYSFTPTPAQISGLSRDIEATALLTYRNAIQVSAPINPGNSGGPLLNAEGEMIGIIVAIHERAQGIAFAIPVDQVIEVAAKILRDTTAKNASHGLKVYQTNFNSAISTQNWEGTNTQYHAIVVESVATNSPAAAAGIQAGDVITSIGKHTIYNSLDFSRAFIDLKPSMDVGFGIMRNNQGTEHLTLTLSTPTREQHLAISKKPLAPALADRAPIAPKTTSQGRITDSDVWEILGIRYAPIQKAEYVQTYPQHLIDFPNGGVTITDVRENSPFANRGIKPNDILVGADEYSTTSPNDIRYIAKFWQDLKSKTQNDSVRIHVIRSGKVFFADVQ